MNKILSFRCAALLVVAPLFVAACDHGPKPPSPMEVCQQLEASKQFSGCKADVSIEGERCPGTVTFTFTWKVSTRKIQGRVAVCRSDDEFKAAAANLYAHNTEWSSWSNGKRRTYIAWENKVGQDAVNSDNRFIMLTPEQASTIELALGLPPSVAVPSAACSTKPACKGAGFCSVVPGKEGNCLAGSDADCLQADICGKQHMCKADLQTGTCR